MDGIVKEELLDRGYSRRQLGRVAALLGAGVAVARTMPAAAQQAARPVAGAIRIGANECWTGPFPVGVAAAARIAATGNRYEPDEEHAKLFAAVAAVEGVPANSVVAWPGSSDPVNRAAITFASPSRGIVTGNPSYEQIWRTGAWLGAKVTRVPLDARYAHDVRAMLAADPHAGVYYVVSPNNPTGTLTPIADIEWLAANKPKDAVLVVDEAYIHWADAPNAARLATGRDDVIVMRTFSKLFGMAGMRLGLTIANPALHARMMRYDGGQVTAMLPMTAVACGTASLPEAALIASRRAEMIRNREAAIARVTARGFKVVPGSRANMFMVDWGRPAGEMQAKLLAEGVQIGRSWDVWPNVGRVTVGSAAEMEAFAWAVERVA